MKTWPTRLLFALGILMQCTLAFFSSSSAALACATFVISRVVDRLRAPFISGTAVAWLLLPPICIHCVLNFVHLHRVETFPQTADSGAFLACLSALTAFGLLLLDAQVDISSEYEPIMDHAGGNRIYCAADGSADESDITWLPTEDVDSGSDLEAAPSTPSVGDAGSEAHSPPASAFIVLPEWVGFFLHFVPPLAVLVSSCLLWTLLDQGLPQSRADLLLVALIDPAALLAILVFMIANAGVWLTSWDDESDLDIDQSTPGLD